MVELKGSLGSIGLPAILQLIGELHHSGNLELTKNGSHGRLGFDDGRLVAASYDDQEGLKALAACSRQLADADFLFVEGMPADARTMDFGGAELQKHLGRLSSGEITPEALAPPHVISGDTQPLEICPLLGFVDDSTRHYSRSTAMHRCFASGAPSLVTSHEQRELCLSGRYSTCPRFRSASVSESPVPPLAVPPSPRAAVSPPGMPPGVAARIAAAGQMRMADPKPDDTVPVGIGPDHGEPIVSPKVNAPATLFGLRSRRGLVLLAIGAALGLLVLAGILVLARPAFDARPAQTPPTAVAQPAEPVPTAIRAAPTAARPTTVPTPAPAVVTLPPEPPTPTVRSAPTVASVPVAGQSLIDVRFASGPKPGWLDNPPFATWSDGAYRLQAKQATHFVAVSAPIDRPLGDVVVSATFRKTGGPPGGGYGLVIRDQSPDPLDGVNQDTSFYVMETGDLGDVGVWRRDGDHWVDLVPWMHSASVRPGGSPNDLSARAVGDRLTFTVNETEVASVQDDTLVAGRVGVFVGGDYNEVALDRFVVQVPD